MVDALQYRVWPGGVCRQERNHVRQAVAERGFSFQRPRPFDALYEPIHRAWVAQEIVDRPLGCTALGDLTRTAPPIVSVKVFQPGTPVGGGGLGFCGLFRYHVLKKSLIHPAVKKRGTFAC